MKLEKLQHLENEFSRFIQKDLMHQIYRKLQRSIKWIRCRPL